MEPAAADTAEPVEAVAADAAEPVEAVATEPVAVEPVASAPAESPQHAPAEIAEPLQVEVSKPLPVAWHQHASLRSQTGSYVPWLWQYSMCIYVIVSLSNQAANFVPYSQRIRSYFEKYPGAMQAWSSVHVVMVMCVKTIMSDSI